MVPKKYSCEETFFKIVKLIFGPFIIDVFPFLRFFLGVFRFFFVHNGANSYLS
jgi:hypothetical protein